MNKIVIGFSKPKKWKPFAELIMFGYKIPFDHVYIRFHSPSFDRDLIYQASGIAVNFMGSDVFNSENDIVKEFNFDIAPDNYRAMIQFAIDNAGKPYGIKEVLGLVYIRFCALLGKKAKNPFVDGDRTWVCCELGSYILKNYLNVNVPIDSADIDPKELYDFLTSLKA